MVERLRRGLRRAGSLRHRGPWSTVAMVVEEAAGLARFGRRSAGRAPAATQLDPDAVALETTRFRTLRRTFDAVPPEARTGGFLDLGCGRGRALLVARSRGFDPVTGVELDPDVAAAARLAVGSRATVVVGDATDHEIPGSVSVVYLSNPFGAASVDRVIARLDDSQRQVPRPLVVAYVNPRHQGRLEAAGFQPLWSDPDAVVLHRSAPPPVV